MSESTTLKDRIEARVNSGILGQWYAVAKSSHVRPGQPHGVTVLGRNLVLWRNEAGTLSCLEDYCPHRGARLSMGVVHEGNIACGYHGVVLDGDGRILRVPAMPECSLEGRKALASYKVQEAADCVFAYFPSVDKPEPTELPLPPELVDPDWTGFLCHAHWDCNYRYALDNLADPMHGCYLHANSFTLAFGAKQDHMKLEARPDGFLVSRVEQVGENFDWTDMVVTPDGGYCRLDIPYPKAAGPGGVFRIIGFTTPVDDKRCMVFFWRLRKVSGLAREVFRFMYRTTLEPRHWHVLEQDRVMLEGMPDDARKREMLYQHDIGVARIRMLMTRQAKAQIAAEDAALTRAAG